jgi:voltage-gated potassium channel Kch
MIVTLATVGYGDVVPHADESRLVVIVMIILAIAILPRIISSVVETWKIRKEGRLTYVPGNRPFVVICINFKREQYVRDVIFRALHILSTKKKSSVHSYRLVILSPNAPPPSIKALISTRVFASLVTYIHGNSLEEADMRRAALRKSSACFVMSDSEISVTSEEAMVEDHKNVLRIWSLKKFSPNTSLFVHNLRPETDLHVRPFVKKAVCAVSIQQTILGINCLYKGAGTLLTNLIHQAPLFKTYKKSWQAGYADGLKNGIYFFPFISFFEGKLFSELCWYLYAEFQVILIGMRLKIPAGIKLKTRKIFTLKDHIILNPGEGFKIPGSHLSSEFIIIAQSLDDVNDIEALNKKEFEETWVKWFSRNPEIFDESEQDFINEFERKLFEDDKSFGKNSVPEDIGGSTNTLNELCNEEDSYFIGHPTPPHHMVIDNDLQSPLCIMTRTPISVKDAYIGDTTAGECSEEKGKWRRLEGHILVFSADFDLWYSASKFLL